MTGQTLFGRDEEALAEAMGRELDVLLAHASTSPRPRTSPIGSWPRSPPSRRRSRSPRSGRRSVADGSGRRSRRSATRGGSRSGARGRRRSSPGVRDGPGRRGRRHRPRVRRRRRGGRVACPSTLAEPSIVVPSPSPSVTPSAIAVPKPEPKRDALAHPIAHAVANRHGRTDGDRGADRDARRRPMTEAAGTQARAAAETPVPASGSGDGSGLRAGGSREGHETVPKRTGTSARSKVLDERSSEGRPAHPSRSRGIRNGSIRTSAHRPHRRRASEQAGAEKRPASRWPETTRSSCPSSCCCSIGIADSFGAPYTSVVAFESAARAADFGAVDAENYGPPTFERRRADGSDRCQFGRRCTSTCRPTTPVSDASTCTNPAMTCEPSSARLPPPSTECSSSRNGFTNWRRLLGQKPRIRRRHRPPFTSAR